MPEAHHRQVERADNLECFPPAGLLKQFQLLLRYSIEDHFSSAFLCQYAQFPRCFSYRKEVVIIIASIDYSGQIDVGLFNGSWVERYQGDVVRSHFDTEHWAGKIQRLSVR